MTHLTKGKITATAMLVTALSASAPAVAAPQRDSGGAQPIPSTLTSVQAPPAGGGFDWGDAGIGAAGMLGLVGAVGAAAATARRAGGRRTLPAGRT
jgi:hypothetical protein